MEQAIAANRVKLCYFCAKRDNLQDTVATEDGVGEVILNQLEEKVDDAVEGLTEAPAEETPAEEAPAA